MRNRIFSLETEYAVFFQPAEGSTSPESTEIVEALIHPLVREYGIPSTQFLINGSKLHHDVGHAEWSLPECRSAFEAAIYDKAADRSLAIFTSEAESSLTQKGHHKGRLMVIKNNADMEGHTYGCHENYLGIKESDFLDLEDYLRLTIRFLEPFLVSRQVFCGSGRAGWGPTLNERFAFQIMQRADFIQTKVSTETQRARPIFNLGREKEPFAEGNYRRLHLILGDANMSGWATWLKLGTTGLLLRLLEELFLPQEVPHLIDPVAALRTFSRDPSCTVEVPLRNGETASAIDVQRIYLRLAEDFLDSYPASSEELEILAQWRQALELLESQPEQLFGKVDWVTKKTLMDHYLASRKLSWEEVEAADSVYYDLLQMDLQYHVLDSQNGLFYRAIQGKADGWLALDLIDRARKQAPPLTRAWLRGCLVAVARANAEEIDSLGWDKAQFRGRQLGWADPLAFFSESLLEVLTLEPWNPQEKSTRQEGDVGDLDSIIEQIVELLKEPEKEDEEPDLSNGRASGRIISLDGGRASEDPVRAVDPTGADVVLIMLYHLVTLLRSDEPELRAKAATALGAVRYPGFLDPCRQWLIRVVRNNSEDPAVRREAIRALAHLGGEAAADTLAFLRSESNLLLRWEAENIFNQQSFEALPTSFSEGGESEPPPLIRFID